jgi:hypothetical protein
MCDWNSGFSPRSTRSWEMSISGRTKPSSLSIGQWSVCSATLIGYLSATTCANSASATEPVTMSLTFCPEANSAPPVENWMMPSLSASAKPRSAAFRVSDEVTLMAGYANSPPLARSSISA